MLIFNNDLHKVVEYCSTILFADDTTLYALSKNPTYLKWCIEHDLKLLLDWLRANKLTLNLSKTQFLVFKPNENIASFDINIDGVQIKPSKSAKFLGLTIDDKLGWGPHINEKLLKIKRNMNMLHLSKNNLNSDTKKLIYYGHIHSRLLYCLVIWGSSCKKSDMSRIIKAQNRCIKLIDPSLKVPQIYKKYKILKFTELIKLEEIKLGYKQINKMLPRKLQEIMDHDHSGRSLKKQHTYNTRNKKIPNLPPAHTQTYLNSFLNRGINSYSSLSYALKNSSSLAHIVKGYKNNIFQ